MIALVSDGALTPRCRRYSIMIHAHLPNGCARYVSSHSPFPPHACFPFCFSSTTVFPEYPAHTNCVPARTNRRPPERTPSHSPITKLVRTACVPEPKREKIQTSRLRGAADIRPTTIPAHVSGLGRLERSPRWRLSPVGPWPKKPFEMRFLPEAWCVCI